MRAFRLLPLAGLLLVSGASAPLLTGCDSSGGTCDSTVQFSTEDITPDGTELGAAIAIGQCVEVEYIGRLADGSGIFDEGTIRRVYSPSNGLIAGFTLGMVEQQVGETRRVVIPPSLGYRNQSPPAREGTASDGNPYVRIPACAAIEFDITVTAIFQDGRQC